MGKKIWLFIALFLLLACAIYVPPSGVPIRLMAGYFLRGIYGALRQGAYSVLKGIKNSCLYCQLWKWKWRQVRRCLIILLACPFMIAGIIGVILPLVPGWPFLLIGFSLLAGEIAYVARLREKYKAILARRAPRLYGLIIWMTGCSNRLWMRLRALIKKIVSI